MDAPGEGLLHRHKVPVKYIQLIQNATCNFFSRWNCLPSGCFFSNSRDLSSGYVSCNFWEFYGADYFRKPPFYSISQFIAAFHNQSECKIYFCPVTSLRLFQGRCQREWWVRAGVSSSKSCQPWDFNMNWGRGGCLNGNIIWIQMVYLSGALLPVQVGQTCQNGATWTQCSFFVFNLFFLVQQLCHCSLFISFVLQEAELRNCTDQRGSGKMSTRSRALNFPRPPSTSFLNCPPAHVPQSRAQPQIVLLTHFAYTAGF